MKKKLLILITLVFSLLITSCNKTKKADIVTSLYPHYDIAKNIVKDELEVSLIVPFGAEVHDFSPTPKDVTMIHKSKLFIYTSNEFEPWVLGLLDTSIKLLNIKENVNIDFTELSAVMHYWTDPFVFIEMIAVIKTAIIQIDPKNADFYTLNATEYAASILSVHDNLSAFLETIETPTIYFAGHNALGGFSQRYNLNIVSLIEDFKPSADNTIKDLESLLLLLKTTNSKFLFIEELVEPKTAKTIKDELQKSNLNIELLELHGYHNITKAQAKKGVSYAELFQQNFTNIKKAFN